MRWNGGQIELLLQEFEHPLEARIKDLLIHARDTASAKIQTGRLCLMRQHWASSDFVIELRLALGTGKKNESFLIEKLTIAQNTFIAGPQVQRKANQTVKFKLTKRTDPEKKNRGAGSILLDPTSCTHLP